MPKLVESPAIATLKEVLKLAFPNLRTGTLVNVTPGSRHTSGLAIDIFFNSRNAQEKAAALALIDVLVKHHGAMKWSDLIFTNFHIGGGVGGFGGDGKTHQSWTKGAHDDHIHLDWVDRDLTTGPKGSAAYIDNPYNWSELAKKTDWRAALLTDLQALAAGRPPTPAAPGAPAASAPAWLPGWWKVVQNGQSYYYRFGSDASVAWTPNAPTSGSAAMTAQRNKARIAFASDGSMTLTWDPAGGMSTVEVFRAQGQRKMGGSSNRGGPLIATRLF